MATVAELLQQYGVTDPSQIGFRYVDIQDPTAGDNVGTATGAEYFNKATGTAIPDMLGNNQFLVVDKATGQVKVQQGWQNEGLSGIYHGFKEIATNPGVQYIASAALLGNLAAGNLGTLGGAAGAGAGTTSAEAAMNALLQEEIASGALGSAAMGGAMGPLTAEQLGASFAADMAAAGYPATAAAAGAGALSGLSASQIANLAKAGVSVAGLLGGGAALSNVGGGSGVSSVGGLSTQGTPMNTPEYYQSLQNYYSSYFPSAPKDVVTPLQQWYSGTFQPSASIPSSPVTIPSNIVAQTSPTAVQALISAINSLKPTITNGTTTASSIDTAAEKANLYNQLIDAGLSDSQVKQAIEANLGPQTPTDWQYLQDAAKVQEISSSTSPVAKAEVYNELISSGTPDTVVRNIVEAVTGPQTDTDWSYLQEIAPAVQQAKEIIAAPGLLSGTAQEKANAYNAMLSSGLSDSAIRNLVEQTLGTQSNTDWQYLQQLASR